MKNLFRIFALLILLILSVMPLAAQHNTAFVSSRVNPLNVRSGPGIEHKVLVVLGRGGLYPVLGSSPLGNWLLIDLGPVQGWVHQAYVTQTTIHTTYDLPADTYGQQQPGYGQPQQPNYGYTQQPGYGQMQQPGYGHTQQPGYGYTQPAPTYDTTIPYIPVTESNVYFPPADKLGVDVSTIQTNNYFNATVGSWVSVNIRRGPGLQYGIVWILPRGDRAVPLARNARGTWYYVDYNGIRGWVTHDLIAVPPSINVAALPVRYK
jgi:uncharacterized protein YraI